MRDHAQPGALPLRPHTTGELLDAAVVLLRGRGRLLLGLGFLVALLEQAALFPLRRLADVDISFLPKEGRLSQFGAVVLAGIGLEAFSIAFLGALAATAAPRALLGPVAPARRFRFVRAVVIGLVVALLCASTGWAFLVLPVPLQVFGLVLAGLATALVWPFVYGLLGLAGPVAVVDERGVLRSIGRSIRLASRSFFRVMWIRDLGYLAWLLIRLGLTLATMALVSAFYTSPSALVDNLIMAGTALLVNTLAYPMLGCLDVALHLDVRMRTEGLDIALRRSVQRGVAPDAALAIPA
ncbi:MAG TPA: hypothetical protein VF163_13815 [Micromonosporaceae bacterium]